MGNPTTNTGLRTDIRHRSKGHHTDGLRRRGRMQLDRSPAFHESPRTTKLYDRRNDEISLDEIERIAI